MTYLSKKESVSRLIPFLAKQAEEEVDGYEYEAGGKKPYAESSERNKRENRSGIDMAWESNEARDAGGEDPEPAILNTKGMG